MPQYIKIRGLLRGAAIRIGGHPVTSKNTVTVDLDDPVTRRDLQKHSAVGAFTVVGSVAPAAAAGNGLVIKGGASAPAPTGDRDVAVTAFTLLLPGNTTQAGAGGTVTVNAPHATQHRRDLISADNTNGNLVYTAGTPADVLPAVPATPANNVPLSTVNVPSVAQQAAGPIQHIDDVRPLPAVRATTNL